MNPEDRADLDDILSYMGVWTNYSWDLQKLLLLQQAMLLAAISPPHFFKDAFGRITGLVANSSAFTSEQFKKDAALMLKDFQAAAEQYVKEAADAQNVSP